MADVCELNTAAQLQEASGSEGRVGRELFRLAWPSVVSSVVQQAAGLMTIFFVSSLDDPYMLGSVGLGSMAQNVFGFSLGIGLNSGLETLASQSFGAGRYEVTGCVLRQAQILSLAICVPCILIMAFAEQLFLVVGIDARTSRDSWEYVMGTVPAMPFYFLYNSTRLFLRSVRVPEPDSYVSIISVVLHPLWCLLFLRVLPWGSFGAGLTVSCSNMVRFVLLTSYTAMRRPGPCGKYWRWFPCPLRRQAALDASSAVSFRAYLAVALPSALLIWSEWWIYEFMALLAGVCGTVALAAHTAVCNVLLILFMAPVGLSGATSTLVGNAMGAGRPELACAVLRAACVFSFLVFILLAAGVLLLKCQLARVFSSDRAVVSTFQSICYFMAPFIILDAVQTVVEGALRGLGKQRIASRVKLISMCVVRLFAAWVLALPLQFGVEGIWMGGLAGMVVTLLAYWFIIHKADFSHISAEVRGGLSLQLHDGA